MNSSPLLFRSSAQPGHASPIADDPRRVIARKLEREIQVSFTPTACTVQTAEGLVHAKPGDAIITGIAGERWRVSRAHFGQKYRPVPPTQDGAPGTYVSLPNRIVAVRMNQAFNVLLADGQSQLTGREGDWLVDYGDGSLGIVSHAIFMITYEIVD
ncbi:MAG TPA: PGDYG domain-containing protein [Steroidobacteraceae bacterium]